MHELSIAQAIIEQLESAITEPADRAGGICTIRLRIGMLTAVVPEALEFSFELAAEGTIAQGAKLDIEQVPLVVLCPLCQAERELPDPAHLVCPICQTRTPDIIRGRELEIISVEVRDAAENH
jgi:hydrogenase nickel incorporation protein HypA/HybF